MRCILSLITLGALVLLGDQSWARRDALTAEQKSQLERIDRTRAASTPNPWSTWSSPA